MGARKRNTAEAAKRAKRHIVLRLANCPTLPRKMDYRRYDS